MSRGAARPVACTACQRRRPAHLPVLPSTGSQASLVPVNAPLVLDLPTRIFHGSFAVLFVAAYAIAQLVDDDAAAFGWHMVLGLTMAVAVVLRILWGVMGSRHARFRSFALHPRALAAYLLDTALRRDRPMAGHNPASSWAAIAMMVCALVLAATGIARGAGRGGDFAEEVHEFAATVFALTALAHVAGVTVHGLRHRDGIAWSMVHGRKQQVDASEGIGSAHVLAGLFFLLYVVGCFVVLARGFDARARTLQLGGTVLHLGEAEHTDDHDDDH